MENVMCAKSELCIFEPLSVQVVAEQASWCDIHPTASIDGSSNSIEFLISGATTNYLDLNDTVLGLSCKVTTSKVEAFEEAAIKGHSVVNYLLHALFTDVKVYLNDVLIEGGDGLYPFKAVIQNELNFSTGTKNVQLRAAGYSEDENKLEKLCNGSLFSLMGALNIDFFQSQSKYLIPGVDVKIVLTRSKDPFVFNTPATEGSKKPHLRVTDAMLYVRKVSCAPAVLLGHELGLEKQNAIYPYQKIECLTYTVSQVSSSFSQESLFRGNIPKFAVVCMVSQRELQGVYANDPSTYEVNFLSFYCDGQASSTLSHWISTFV